MPKFLSNRKQRKLYKQWVENSGLSPEDLPGTVDDGDEHPEVTSEESSIWSPSQFQGSLSLRITWRHIWYLIIIILVLLITTITLSTVLIARSC